MTNNDPTGDQSPDHCCIDHLEPQDPLYRQESEGGVHGIKAFYTCTECGAEHYYFYESMHGPTPVTDSS